MGRLCFISRAYRNRTSSGNKAKSDYEDILTAAGAVNLGLERTYGDGKARGFVRNLAGVVAAAARLRPGDTLVLQYPVKKYFAVVCRVARMRGARTVALIHDLGSWRRRKLTVAQELRRLDNADVVAATNPVMAQWLAEQGFPEEKLLALGLHDYLSDAQPPEAAPTDLGSVAYAGALNMRKNAFLLEMKELKGVHVELYGSLKDYTPEHITAHGFVEPDAFIRGAKGAWGLVWDGDSLDACTGAWGEYLSVNTPHKSAFYLRAGLPLIVWSRSAIAPIVRERGIGLCVDSLRELPDLLASITLERYRALRASALREGERAARGENLRALLASPPIASRPE